MELNKNTQNLQISPAPVQESRSFQNENGANTLVLSEKVSPFKEEFDKLLGANALDPSQFVPLAQLQPLADFSISAEDAIQIDTKTIENIDAMFFLNISNQGENNLNLQIKDSENVIDAANYKTMPVSKTLGDIIMKASENNKSVRLDFDNQVTVVLKVSQEGKIDATFIPQDKQVENYLKNNIDYLKVRFDEQNIAYSNINYKPYRQNKQNNKQGEKNNEWCIR